MWAAVFPFCLAAWLFLAVVFASYSFGRKSAETDGGTDRIRRRPVQRGFRWVFWLSVAYGGLIVVVCFPSWFYWGQMHVRGVAVLARVVSRSLELSEEGRQITSVTYEFEAEVDGQRRTFQREGTLRGWHFPVSVRVLYEPSDPSESKMAQEVGEANELLLSLASFLVLGVASFVLSRRLSYAGAVVVSDQGQGPPVEGTAVVRRKDKPRRRTRNRA